MAAAQVLVYIGAISVLILFAIMLTQSKSGPGGSSSSASGGSACIAAIVLVVLLLSVDPAHDVAAGGGRDPSRRTPGTWRGPSSTDYLFAFEVVGVLLLAAVIGGLYLARREPGHARDEPAPSVPSRREPGERMSQSLDAYLILAGLLFGIGAFGFLAKRNAIAMLMCHRDHAQRGQPRDRRVRRVQSGPGARGPGLDDRAVRHGGRRGRSDRRASPSSSPSTGTGGRHWSTSTPRCGNEA